MRVVGYSNSTAGRSGGQPEEISPVPPTLIATGQQACAAPVARGPSPEGLLTVPTLLSRDRSGVNQDQLATRSAPVSDGGSDTVAALDAPPGR
jgi:hypothetical protein